MQENFRVIPNRFELAESKTFECDCAGNHDPAALQDFLHSALHSKCVRF